MNLDHIRTNLDQALQGSFDFYERRPGRYQLIAPILHEDGDMVDIYLEDSPLGETYVRICDFGMALMRLSYTFDISTPTRRGILDSILTNNRVKCQDGNLYLDVPLKGLYEGVLQFAGCAQRVCNMQYWGREIVRSAFYDDLASYVETDLGSYEPQRDVYPLSEIPICPDWSLTCRGRGFYVFGVLGNDKAKNVAISLLEFQKAKLSFISLVVHEDMEALGARERLYLTRNADTQYPVLSDFREKALDDIERLAGMPAVQANYC